MKKCMFYSGCPFWPFTGLYLPAAALRIILPQALLPHLPGKTFSETSSAMVTADAQSVPEKHLNIVTTIFPGI